MKTREKQERIICECCRFWTWWFHQYNEYCWTRERHVQLWLTLDMLLNICLWCCGTLQADLVYSDWLACQRIEDCQCDNILNTLKDHKVLEVQQSKPRVVNYIQGAQCVKLAESHQRGLSSVICSRGWFDKVFYSSVQISSTLLFGFDYLFLMQYFILTRTIQKHTRSGSNVFIQSCCQT